MANELTLTASLAFTKGGISASLGKNGLQLNVSGTSFAEGSATVPTSVAAIPLGSVATPGYLYMLNLDATNYVQIYDAVAGNPCVKLKPGEVALFRVNGTAPAWKANTAACSVVYLLISD